MWGEFFLLSWFGGWGGSIAGTWLVETTDASVDTIVQGAVPQQDVTWPQMSIMHRETHTLGCFEIVSFCAALAILKLAILLPQPPKCSSTMSENDLTTSKEN